MINKKFSISVIKFMAHVITGGPNNDLNKREWIYRSKGEIINFFKKCGYDIKINEYGRLNCTEKYLININNEEGIDGISKIINQLINPINWGNDNLLMKKFISKFNNFLFHDGYEIFFKKEEQQYILKELSSICPSVDIILKRNFFQIKSIKQDLNRALSSLKKDPSDSITASCSFVESVCKHILYKLEKPDPKEKNINNLVKAVIDSLNFNDNFNDKDNIDNDFKVALKSLGNIVQCISNFRNKLGDAHGHSFDQYIIKPTYARLVFGAACTLALFLVDNFEEYKLKKVI